MVISRREMILRAELAILRELTRLRADLLVGEIYSGTRSAPPDQIGASEVLTDALRHDASAILSSR